MMAAPRMCLHKGQPSGLHSSLIAPVPEWISLFADSQVVVPPGITLPHWEARLC